MPQRAFWTTFIVLGLMVDFGSKTADQQQPKPFTLTCRHLGWGPEGAETATEKCAVYGHRSNFPKENPCRYQTA
jgi:hypothetical protein